MQQKPPIFYSHQELNDMNRDRRKRIHFWGAFILFLIIVAGIVVFFVYSSKNSQLPLPSSAKTISTNTIQVPFPYRESQNGEAWNLIKRDQDKILKITDNENTAVDIPLPNKPTPLYATKSGKRYLVGYRYNMNTTIQLGNKVYTITEIDLNSDNTSGKVILTANP